MRILKTSEDKARARTITFYSNNMKTQTILENVLQAVKLKQLSKKINT